MKDEASAWLAHVITSLNDATTGPAVPDCVESLRRAEVIAGAIRVLCDWRAGEAEAAGVSISEIGSVTGQTSTSNTRRKYPHMKAFRDARKAAALSGVTIPVHVRNDISIQIAPNDRG